jgi:excisionase family DNA binding protein
VSIENAGRQALTVAETAQRLSVHPATVRRMLDRGDLARIRIGRLVRVDLASLDAFIGGGGDEKSVTADQISSGQVRALHAKAAQLDKLTGAKAGHAKAAVLRAATGKFGHDITSTLDLSTLEADWVLDLLAGEISRA